MTRDEAMNAAADVYRAILTDPERAAALREHRARTADDTASTTASTTQVEQHRDH